MIASTMVCACSENTTWHFGIKMKEHHWEYCDHCEHDVVICGKCGNNTCNGGYGTVDGKECDACPSAYELYLNKMNNRK